MHQGRASLIRLRADERPARGAIMQRYSLFKLGCASSVDYYARRLLRTLTQGLCAWSETTWVITGPAITAVPAAANLLAWRIERLSKSEGSRPILTIRNIRKMPEADWLSKTHYAQLNHAARRKWQQHSRTLWRAHEWFNGANIILVNDVYVTGAQEEELRECFARAGVARVHWLYIAEFDVIGATRASTLETGINDFRVPSVNEFVNFLSNGSFTPTTKLVWRLFALGVDDFKRAIESLEPRQKTQIHNFVRRNGSISNAHLCEKLRWLESGKSLFHRRKVKPKD